MTASMTRPTLTAVTQFARTLEATRRRLVLVGGAHQLQHRRKPDGRYEPHAPWCDVPDAPAFDRLAYAMAYVAGTARTEPANDD